MYLYKNILKNLHNYGIQTADLMHSIGVIQPLCYVRQHVCAFQEFRLVFEANLWHCAGHVTWRLVSDIRVRRGPRRHPPAGPAQAMTLPAQASTWISRMPISASRQCLAAVMWRRTALRLRNRPQLDSSRLRPLAVQCAHTNRVTRTPSPGRAGSLAGISLALAAMTATAASNRVIKMDWQHEGYRRGPRGK